MTSSIIVNPTTITTYSLTATDINGCSGTNKVIVDIYQLPVPKVWGDTEVCAGGSVVLNASGGVNYNWSNGLAGSSIIAVTNSNTTYIVTIINKNNCQAKDSIFVKTYLLTSPKIDVSGGGLIYCQGEKIALKMSVPNKYYTYLWSSGSTTSAINVRTEGKYFVKVSDISGKCNAYSDTVIVSIKPLPQVDFIYKDSALTVNFSDMSMYDTAYTWHFGDGITDIVKNPTHIYNNYGYYTVKLIAYNSCGTDSTQKLIYLRNVGIENNINISNLELYPNPASEIINLRFTTSKVDNMQILIFTPLGNSILLDNFIKYEGEYNRSLNLSNFAKGIYLIQIKTDKGNTSIRFILE
jgi:PKD repeat protein